MHLPCKLITGNYVGRISLVFALVCVGALQPAIGQSFTVKDLGTLPQRLLQPLYGHQPSRRGGWHVGDQWFVSTSCLFAQHGRWSISPLPGAAFSEALGINNHGDVVGFSGRHGPIRIRFFGQNGVLVSLGTLPGGNDSQALGINDNGQVVGFSPTASGDRHAFLFENGVMVDLGTLPGGTFSPAYGINDRGQVVGEASTASGDTHAFLFENGVMVDLGTLPGGTQQR